MENRCIYGCAHRYRRGYSLPSYRDCSTTKEPCQMGKEQLLWQEQAQAKSVSKGKISLFYIFDVFQAHSGLLAYLPIIVVTICIFGGLSWQVFLPITDPARYQCYALTFWLG